MDKPAFKPELRLIIQASVPVEEIFEADEIYKQLKILLKNYNENVTINGQILKNLQPCCREKN